MGELFNAVDKDGNSPLLCLNTGATVQTVLELDRTGDLARDIKASLLLNNASRIRNLDLMTALLTMVFMEDAPDEDGTSIHLRFGNLEYW